MRDIKYQQLHLGVRVSLSEEPILDVIWNRPEVTNADNTIFVLSIFILHKDTICLSTKSLELFRLHEPVINILLGGKWTVADTLVNDVADSPTMVVQRHVD